MSLFSEYAAHGWRLCGIDPGKKGPVYDAWNVNPRDPADIELLGQGAGLLHVLSGTCALDIDVLSSARKWLGERGVDVDSLLVAPDAVRIESGRPGRAKLLYRLSNPLRTVKPAGSGLELRCATAGGKSVQDVLPPSIHPVTKKPYQWAYGEPLLGHWSVLPPIPSALLAAWREVAEPIAAPKTTPPTQPAAREPIQITELRQWLADKNPDCEHDPWLAVGMKIHDATNGSEDGYELWNEWSARAKNRYLGPDHVRTRYVSFSSAPGKAVATLRHELPATAEDFPPEPKADGPTTEEAFQASAKELKKKAISVLEKRLVFVYSEERYFDCERHKLISSDNAIEHMFTSMMPLKNGARISPIKMLKESSTKQYVDALGFHPGEGPIFKSGDDSYANVYRNRLPDPIEPVAAELEKIAWIFDRIDDPRYRQWLLQFYGHVVQKPGVKIKSAPLIWSDTQGNGKTTLVRMVPALLVGARYSREVNTGLLHSDFNDYLLNAWHINLTEFRAGTKGEREAISKKVENWIADDVIGVHPKGRPGGYDMPNHLFITSSSNAEDAAAVSNQDRKWGIHEMRAAQFTEAEQQWIYHEFLLTPRAAGVLRHYFLNVDLTGFVASARAIQTDARQEMVAASVSSDLELLQIAFEQRSGPFEKDVVLSQDVRDFVCKNSRMSPSVDRIGKLLCRAPFNGDSFQFRYNTGRFRAVSLWNKDRWRHMSGVEIMRHIAGEDIDISA